MDNIDKMLEEVKSYAELQVFAEAQNNLILELRKKLSFIEEKNTSLEKIINDSNISTLDVITLPITNQELISREQLEILKKSSSERELTLEECKKVSEYTKILKDIQNNKPAIPSTARKLTEAELIKKLEYNE